MPQPHKNYASIDLAKFAAALLVVVLHLGPGGLFVKQFLCRLAVPFFLVCAGYFLFSKLQKGSSPSPVVLPYFLRILRLYAVWTVLYYLALPLFTLSYNRQEIAFLVHPLQLLQRLFLTGSWSVLWYLLGLLWAVALCWLCLRLGLGAKGTLIAAALLHLFGLAGQGIASFSLQVPLLGALLNAVRLVFDSTRNGPFFSFFYVALGLWLASRPLPSRRFAAGGLALSAPLLCCEVYAVQHFFEGAASAPDYYLLTIPTIFFLFALLIQVGGEAGSAHRALRTMSTLIYCSHILVWLVLGFVCWLLGISLSSPALFALVLGLSSAFSLAVTFLARRQGFRWLRWLY